MNWKASIVYGLIGLSLIVFWTWTIHLVAARSALAAAAAESQRLREALEVVKRLAEWSEKYPRGRTYPVSAKIDQQLIEIEESAKRVAAALQQKGDHE